MTYVCSDISDRETLPKDHKSLHDDNGLQQKVANMMYKLFPIEELKDLPRIYAFSLIAVIYACLVGIFIYFLQDVYSYKQKEKFLSLDANAGTCEEVTSEIDGTYLADIGGNWEGSVGFEYSLAIYSATFRRFRGPKKEYDSILNQAFANMEIATNKSYSQNLAANVLVWMTSSDVYESNGAVQTISYTGSPKAVFNRKVWAAGLSDELGNCEIIPTVSYDKNSGIVLITWDYSAYIASAACMHISDPLHMGFVPYSNSFVLQLDIQAVMVAVGVNHRIIPPEQLEVIRGTEFSFTTLGVEYHGALTYHPRNPSMEPLICLEIGGSQYEGARKSLPMHGHLQ